MNIKIEGTETGVIHSAQVIGKNHLLLTMSGRYEETDEDITTAILVKIVDSRRVSDSLSETKIKEKS